MLVWRQGVRVVQIGNCTRDCKSVAGTRGSCDRKPEALTRNCPAVTQGQQSTSTVAIGAQFSFLCVYPRLFRVVGVISLHSTTIHANPVFVSCDHTTIRRRRGQRPAATGFQSRESARGDNKPTERHTCYATSERHKLTPHSIDDRA